jgi:hypothetical protein
LDSLKQFKIWMDGQGPFPAAVHPALRLEDKWVQYQVLNTLVPMPETAIFDKSALGKAEAMLEKWGRLALKRRLGRGGRDFRVIGDLDGLRQAVVSFHALILQRYIDSRVNGYTLSVRAVAFGGEFVCMYANLARRAYSNHGVLAFVSEGKAFGLRNPEFSSERFDEKSWEANIWFGGSEPDYLRHNLYEDEVGKTSLLLPHSLLFLIKQLAIKIERFYEGLNFVSLPVSWFEKASATKGLSSHLKTLPKSVSSCHIRILPKRGAS